MVTLIVKIALAVATLSVVSMIFLNNVSSSQPIPQNSVPARGGISGRVLDANDHPISDAMVLADRPDIVIRPTPMAWTNKDGEFIIEDLIPGSYSLHGSKQEEGYPRTEFNFYDPNESSGLKVEVYERQTTQKVIIQLGLKAAVLVGRVVDASTNQPLPHANITLRRVDHPERFLSTGLFWHGVKGGFRLLVPSLPFTVKVSEPGYQDWYYRKTGKENQPSALLLAPNSTKSLLVALRPRRAR